MFSADSARRRVVFCALILTGQVVGAAGASGQTSQSREREEEPPPLLVSNSDVGYIDQAIVGTHIRIRYDSGFGIDRPDRAEFFYAKCGCYRPDLDPNAPGPVPSNPQPPGRVVETEIDYVDIRAYVEYAFGRRFSWFGEVPFRYIRPKVNASAFGIGDVQTGVKFAAIASENRYVTMQFRTYVSTGDPFRGLGTDHVSVEPALLYLEKVTDRLTLESELAYWHPTFGSSTLGVNGPSEPPPPGRFSSDVIRYGIGLSYKSSSRLTLSPVVELVGWHVRDGFETRSIDGFPDPPRIGEPSGGKTILNLKAGVRVGPVYVGYGHALTNDIWYEQILRIEYRYVY